jgi:DNA helicase-2/ATP-dependent DNA helicase PcrA
VDGDVPNKPKGVFHRAETGNDGYSAREAFRPFDGAAYAGRRLTRDAAAGDGLDLEIGERVRHKKFGDGLVIDADGKTLTVMFDAEGRKKLARGLAPISKIQ